MNRDATTAVGGDQARRQTITYLYADLAGSTQLARKLADGFPGLLRRFHELVRQAVEGQGGRIERTEGDLLRCDFNGPAEAIRAAHDIDVAMAGEQWPNGSSPQCRIGIHTGTGADVADIDRARAVGEAAQAGQVLLSEATARLVEEEARRMGWPLVPLGSFDAGHHGESERIVRIDFPDVPTVLARPRARSRSGSRIPSPATAIVGRDEDLDGVTELLGREAVRLVTITGPGGTGKTRLSIALARSLEGNFADGAVFVELAAVQDPDQMLVAVARALGIFEGPHRTVVEALSTVAGDAEILLVLDNTEQIPGAARAIGQVIEAMPSAKVVVTSRSPLRSSWEHEYPLSPLAVPADSAGHEEIGVAPAVTLLVERARGVRPSFTITPENESVLAEITRRLDGLPLAIELAATRLRILSPDMLLDRLDDSLATLDRGPADAPERHRTLRAAIEWSHESLPDDEKRLFRRLGVFAGGFPLEAVDAVCGEASERTLEELVAKSLVVFALDEEGGPRYRLLETLREFAVEELRSSGEELETRARHLDWCRGLASRIEDQLATPFFPELLNLLERERHNLNAAMSWALSSGTGIEEALELCGQIPLFWDTRGFVTEGLDWSRRLIAAADPGPTPGKAMALATIGWLGMLAGDPELSAKSTTESIAMWHVLENEDQLCRTLAMQGMTSYNIGLLDKGEAEFEEAIALARGRPTLEWIADAWCPYGLAHIALARGDTETTLRYLNQVLEYSKNRGLTWGVGHAQLSLGLLAFWSGDHAQAVERLSESLLVRQELRDARGICDCLGMMALVASSSGEHRLAAVLLGAAERRREASGHHPVPWQQPLLEAAAGSAQAAMGDSYEEAVAEGRAMAPDDAIRFAVEKVGGLTAGAAAS